MFGLTRWGTRCEGPEQVMEQAWARLNTELPTEALATARLTLEEAIMPGVGERMGAFARGYLCVTKAQREHSEVSCDDEPVGAAGGPPLGETSVFVLCDSEPVGAAGGPLLGETLETYCVSDPVGVAKGPPGEKLPEGKNHSERGASKFHRERTPMQDLMRHM